MIVKNEYFKLVMLALVIVTPVVSPSIALPISVITLASLVAYQMYLNNKKEELEQTTKNEIDSLKTKVEQDLISIKNSMNGLIIKNSVKPTESEFKRFF